MEELTDGMNLVKKSIKDIYQISDVNSEEAQNVLTNIEEPFASIQHIALTVESLSQMAHELEAVVTKFKLS